MLHHNSNIAVGKALVDAVFLEEREACYPRVIISNDLITLANTSSEISIIVKDHDDKYFVNYLMHSEFFLVACLQDRAEPFKHIHRIITEKINTLLQEKCNSKVIVKWNWLVKKFNSSLNFHKSQYNATQFGEINEIPLLGDI